MKKPLSPSWSHDLQSKEIFLSSFYEWWTTLLINNFYLIHSQEIDGNHVDVF